MKQFLTVLMVMAVTIIVNQPANAGKEANGVPRDNFYPDEDFAYKCEVRAIGYRNGADETMSITKIEIVRGKQLFPGIQMQNNQWEHFTAAHSFTEILPGERLEQKPDLDLNPILQVFFNRTSDDQWEVMLRQMIRAVRPGSYIPEVRTEAKVEFTAKKLSLLTHVEDRNLGRDVLNGMDLETNCTRVR